MIRGLYISRYLVSGAITMTIFVTRAISNLGVENAFIDFMIEPIVVYCLFMTAAIIVAYPWLKGPKALIIMPIIAGILGLFVYAYYML